MQDTKQPTAGKAGRIIAAGALVLVETGRFERDIMGVLRAARAFDVAEAVARFKASPACPEEFMLTREGRDEQQAFAHWLTAEGYTEVVPFDVPNVGDPGILEIR